MNKLIVCFLFCAVPILATGEEPAGVNTTDTVDLAQLAKNRTEWPAEITLTKTLPFPVVINGKESGSVELPPGTSLKLVAVLGAELKVSFGDVVKLVPAGATDIVERVIAIRTLRAGASNKPPKSPSSTSAAASQQIPDIRTLSIEYMDALYGWKQYTFGRRPSDFTGMMPLSPNITDLDRSLGLMRGSSNPPNTKGFTVPLQNQLGAKKPSSTKEYGRLFFYEDRLWAIECRNNLNRSHFEGVFGKPTITMPIYTQFSFGRYQNAEASYWVGKRVLARCYSTSWPSGDNYTMAFLYDLATYLKLNRLTKVDLERLHREDSERPLP